MGCMPRDATAWGRIGGLTAWARNEPQTMVEAAHLGFRRRFERIVDPDEVLEAAERARRADRARRAHMLHLADLSAKARRRKTMAASADASAGTTHAEGHDHDPSAT